MYKNDRCLALHKHLENVNSFLLFAFSSFIYSDFFIYLFWPYLLMAFHVLRTMLQVRSACSSCPQNLQSNRNMVEHLFIKQFFFNSFNKSLILLSMC